jgi:hypothetical protein
MASNTVNDAAAWKIRLMVRLVLLGVKQEI